MSTTVQLLAAEGAATSYSLGFAVGRLLFIGALVWAIVFFVRKARRRPTQRPSVLPPQHPQYGWAPTNHPQPGWGPPPVPTPYSAPYSASFGPASYGPPAPTPAHWAPPAHPPAAAPAPEDGWASPTPGHAGGSADRY